MKKILIAITLSIVLLSCHIEPVQKPFIITHKFPSSGACNKGYCGYEYTDAKGNNHYFCEDVNKYDIGDTIK